MSQIKASRVYTYRVRESRIYIAYTRRAGSLEKCLGPGSFSKKCGENLFCVATGSFWPKYGEKLRY